MGIKSYPAGVTTNSSSGVISYKPFYPVFAAMEECGLALNLHGECPSDHKAGITVLNGEASFLPTLLSLHAKFPALKIVGLFNFENDQQTSQLIVAGLGALYYSCCRSCG